MEFSRRQFLGSAAAMSAATALGHEPKTQEGAKPIKSSGKAVVITKYTGMQSIDGAYEMLRRGQDTLDAAIFVLKAQEDDPNDNTVGLGGLPNEDGEVELDAAVMHGPTRRAAAVGGVRRIRNVAALAKTVMAHTGHALLVHEGAARVAKLFGFKEEDLLTERSRQIWQLWKESMSEQDWWGPSIADPAWKPPQQLTNVPVAQVLRERIERKAQEIGIDAAWRKLAVDSVLYPPTGTIPCIALNEKGEMSAAVSTSGLAWKIPGRLGDSPVIGAGIYLDPEIGGVGSTGSGEENIKLVGAHTVVENMRRGMTPLEAGMDALRRLAHAYNNDMTRLRYINLVFHILRRDGQYAGVSLWPIRSNGQQISIAVHDGTKRLENVKSLFDGKALSWPPIPELPT